MRYVVMVGALLCLTACATSSQGKFRPLGSPYLPKPPTFVVEVFRSAAPERPFERIARLDAHYEKTFFVSTAMDAAVKELQAQARAAGADAIIEIHEQRSRVYETLILHVSATGIRYTSSP